MSTHDRLPSSRRRTQALLLGAIACPTDPTGSATAAFHEPRTAVDSSADAEAEVAAATVSIAGRYRYAGGSKERQALADAVEDVVAEMNFIARPIARKRLLESNMPSAELHLLITDQDITIARPGRPTVSAPRDGSKIVWKSPDGDEFEVRHRLVGDTELVQEFVGDGNRSENVFSLSDGSRVTVQTTITADRLPKTLRFRTTYVRKTQS